MLGTHVLDTERVHTVEGVHWVGLLLLSGLLGHAHSHATHGILLLLHHRVRLRSSLVARGVRHVAGHRVGLLRTRTGLGRNRHACHNFVKLADWVFSALRRLSLGLSLGLHLLGWLLLRWSKIKQIFDNTLFHLLNDCGFRLDLG